MTKIKEIPGEAKVRNKVLIGKIAKAKDLKVVPESPHSKQICVKLRKMPLYNLSTPLPKARLTCTSTPMTINNSAQPRREIYQTMPTLSPVLCEIGNLTTRSRSTARTRDLADKKNKQRLCSACQIIPPEGDVKRKRAGPKNSLTNNTVQKRSKISDESEARITSGKQSDQPKQKSVPLRSHSNAASSQQKGSNLRVLVARCSLDSISNSTVDRSSRDKSLALGNKRTRQTQEKECAHKLQADNTLVNKLRSDWSNTTFEDTPNKDQLASGKTIYKTPLGISKRRLTTLLEISFNESTGENFPAKRQLVPGNSEDAYSSSAEFESDDEKENAHSKRAPTWKDLSHKTTQSINFSVSNISPKVRVRRSRRVSEISSASSDQAKRRILRRNLSPTSKEINSNTESSSNENQIMPLCPNSPSLPRSVQQANELQSEEVNEKGHSLNNSVNAITETNEPSSPLSSPHNLFHKSDLIEQLLSAAEDGGEENAPSNDLTNCTTTVNHANTTKKFFHSRIDSTLPVSNTVKTASKRRTTTGKKKKKDSVYEFLSQSTSDSNDPLSDVIQKLINTGKVTLAKRKKGAGKNVIPKSRRKDPAKKNIKKGSDDRAKPKPNPQSNRLNKNSEHEKDMDDYPHFEDGGGDLFEEDPKRDERGFSDLARSAMIKHAGKNQDTPRRTMITDRKKLLEIAQKFIGQSTPLGPPKTPVNATAQYSPIPGNSSPWRVDDDKLPTMFYFGRNSDNLPSFSSDYIPSTPIKNKSNSKSTSSFSSNDSNMENMAPPSVPATSNENNNQIYSNTRRALSYRSPLKAINILDVVHLPRLSLKKPEEVVNKEITRKEKSTDSEASVASKTNLFGFEEMINDDDAPTSVVVDQSVIPSKQNLKEKLLTLKRLRPERPVLTNSQNHRIRPVFDERPKQRTLQQMFCSTMIDNEQPSMTTNELSNLFKDPEPETTFDSSNPRRTYSRPFVRKRKLRHNFVMFLDSDASDEEDDIKSDKNYAQKTKKRKNKEQKDNIEMNKFVDEFNEMYKEVSEYNLVVE